MTPVLKVINNSIDSQGNSNIDTDSDCMFGVVLVLYLITSPKDEPFSLIEGKRRIADFWGAGVFGLQVHGPRGFSFGALIIT